MGTGFPGDTVVKNPPANAGDSRNAHLISKARKFPEEAVATHSSIHAWEIP